MIDVDIVRQDEDPDAAFRETLFRLLGEDNSRRTGRSDRAGFAVVLRNRDDGEVIGGLSGIDDFGWGAIELLFVPEALQGRGLGRELVAQAESIARERGMIGMSVNTYDFQARGFYEKLDYAVFAELEAGPGAAGQIFLRKRLV